MKVEHREENAPSVFYGDGVRTNPGDVVDVDEEVGERLLQREWFTAVETDDHDADNDEAVVDWNEEDWLSLNWQQREEDVEAGRVDEHLDTIIDVESSKNVREVAETRRSELQET